MTRYPAAPPLPLPKMKPDEAQRAREADQRYLDFAKNAGWYPSVEAKGQKMQWFLVFAASLALVPVKGWFLHILWGWFIVPLGVPSIGIAHVIGISILLTSFSVKKLSSSKNDDDDSPGPMFVSMLKSLFVQAVLLGIAWIFHCFM